MATGIIHETFCQSDAVSDIRECHLYKPRVHETRDDNASASIQCPPTAVCRSGDTPWLSVVA